MYKLKMIIVSVITFVITICVNTSLPDSSEVKVLKIFAIPMLVCLIGFIIFRKDFARKSAGTVLFIDLILCILSEDGWSNVPYLFFLEEDLETTYAIYICIAISTSVLIASRSLVLSIPKLRDMYNKANSSEPPPYALNEPQKENDGYSKKIIIVL